MKAFIALALCFVLLGCAGTTSTGTGTTTVVTAAENLSSIATVLAQYLVMANAEVAAANALYQQTKDANALEKVTYWTQYAAGVAANIAALAEAAKK